MTPDDPRRPRPDEPGSGAPTVDELASALLDGALTGAEEEAVRARPDVVSRAAEMEAARAALRAAVPSPAPSAEVRDRAIAAALAAFDEAGTPAGTPPGRSGSQDAGRGEVPDLASRRSGRSGGVDPHLGDGRRRGAPRWLGAAAAAVALVAGVAGLAIISSGGSDDDESAEGGDAAATVQEDAEMDTSDDDSAGDATAAAPEAGGESDESGGSGGSGGSSPSAAIPVEAGDLGAFRSVDHLVDQVDGMADGAYGVVTPDVAARSSADALDQFGPGCDGGLPETLADPEVTLRLHATAMVAGQPVDAWSTEGPGGRRVVVLAADCTVVADRPAD
jgi:hypothetical protein